MPRPRADRNPRCRSRPSCCWRRGPSEGIGAAIFDVDGVLTDGRIYIGERGEEFKAFSTLDGHGLKLLAQAGIVPAIITGRDSPAVRRRAADLGIAHAVYGAADKLAAAQSLLDALGLDWSRVAVMGDDWPDLPVLSRAAFACAPANAHAEVKAVVHHVTAASGGHGAAREFCDLLLIAAGRYAALLHGPLRSLDGGSLSTRSRPRAGLEDDDPVDLSFAGPEPIGPAAAPWYARLLDVGSAYLPLLLMAALAAGTWWLVRNAPTFEAPHAAAPLRHEADYVMTNFVVQRFAADGSLRTQIEGRQLRHYPDNDTLEIDDARIRAIGDNGTVTLATARRALANGDGSEVQLIGDARVTRPAEGNEEEIEFRSEFLQAFRNVEQVRSNQPVVMTQGENVVHAENMDYDNLSQLVDFKGRSSATFVPPSEARRMSRAAGLHHRRLERPRPGAGGALPRRRLSAGAGGAARRRGRALGAGCRRRGRRASPSTPPTCATSPRSSPPARPASPPRDCRTW